MAPSSPLVIAFFTLQLVAAGQHDAVLREPGERRSGITHSAATIEEAFKSRLRVPVIVWLLDNAYSRPSYQHDLGLKRQAIRSLQDAAIALIPNATITRRYTVTNGFAATIDLHDYAVLTQSTVVRQMVLDQRVHALVQESRALIRADIATTTFGVTGQGITVAVLDTGLSYNHPAMQQSYVGGYDFVNNDPDPFDDHGHGTGVAGIVASRGQLISSQSWFLGVAPQASIVAVKVLSATGFGMWSDTAAGVDWCVNNAQAFNIHVVNMSLGTIGVTYTPAACPTIIDPAIQNAVSANLVVVSASGNDGSTTGLVYPACHPQVLTVGATYDVTSSISYPWPIAGGTCTESPVLDTICCFTNRSPELDVLAPGALIYTPSLGTAWQTTAGTSSAAPHASGVAALLFQSNPNLTPVQVKAMLRNSSVQITDTVTSLTFPRLDAVDALNSLPSITMAGVPQGGSTLTFTLSDVTNPNALLVFGVSGSTSPGIALGDGRIIPLTFDPLLTLFLTAPGLFGMNPPTMTNAQGQATAVAVLPPLTLTGLTIYTGFLTLDPVTSGVYSISSALPVTFL